MGGATVIDHLPDFIAKAEEVYDMAAGTMAADIERLAKLKAPVKTGMLAASGTHKRVELAKFRVSFGDNLPSEKYAAYQEFGQRRDGSHRVENYTTAGTGAHYLGSSGDSVSAGALTYIEAANRSINL